MVKITHADIGDYWTPEATFTVGGVDTDPTNITVKQKEPDGTETTIVNNVLVSTLTTASQPLSKTAIGKLRLNPGIALDAAGYWFTRFEGTGAAAATEEHQITVDPSEFTGDAGLSSRALVGLAETKDWLNQNNVDTSSDLEIVRVINDVSELAHSEGGREFKRTDSTSAATARTFPVDLRAWKNRRVEIGDLSTTPTSVKILAADWATEVATVTDYMELPSNRPAWAPVTELQFNSSVIRPWPGQLVEVTGVWGFPSVPGELRQAVLDAVADTLDRDVEHYRQDYEPRSGGTGTNVIVLGSRPTFLPANARSLSVFRSFRDPHLG